MCDWTHHSTGPAALGELLSVVKSSLSVSQDWRWVPNISMRGIGTASETRRAVEAGGGGRNSTGVRLEGRHGKRLRSKNHARHMEPQQPLVLLVGHSGI